MLPSINMWWAINAGFDGLAIGEMNMISSQWPGEPEEKDRKRLAGFYLDDPCHTFGTHQIDQTTSVRRVPTNASTRHTGPHPARSPHRPKRRRWASRSSLAFRISCRGFHAREPTRAGTRGTCGFPRGFSGSLGEKCRSTPPEES